MAEEITVGRLEAAGAGAHCEAVLRSLPAWFGIEAAVVQYVEEAPRLEAYGAWRGAAPRAGAAPGAAGEVVGFLGVKRPFPEAAEVYVMGVRPEHHRRGLGRRLLEAAEGALRASGVRLLQVKTLSPARENAEYARTRAFYLARGFLPLEEFPELWGPANPCLQLVKVLG
jgi:ribosomal protein S18 acetylase RimI-like enzyme